MSVEKAKQTLKLFKCDEVIIISRKYLKDKSKVTVSTYGKTKEACLKSAVVGDQFMSIIKAQPGSLKEALEIIEKK